MSSWPVVACQIRIEDDDGLGGQRTVLGRTERHDLDAGLPCDFGRGQPERCHGIGKPRPIHMHAQTPSPRDFGKCADLVGRIDGTEFGRLRDGQGGRLHMMHDAGRECRQRGLQRRRIDPGTRPRKRHQLRPARKHLGRAAFIDMHMGQLMAHNGAMWRRHGRQRQGVGGRPGDDRKDRNLAFEDRREPAAQARGHPVRTIGSGRPVIFPCQRIQNLGSGARRIVTREIHLPFSIRCRRTAAGR